MFFLFLLFKFKIWIVEYTYTSTVHTGNFKKKQNKLGFTYSKSCREKISGLTHKLPKLLKDERYKIPKSKYTSWPWNYQNMVKYENIFFFS